MDWLALAKDFGAPLALVVFFVIETKRREERMCNRIDEVENYTRTELSALTRECTAALNRNSNVMEKFLELSGEPTRERS